MRLETLLPLGKVDPGLRAPETPLDLHAVGADARLLEDIGYDGLVVEETKDDPFVIMALAAQATRRLRLGTSVAIAFPRSPTVTALSAWTIQKLSGGRFTLGLGTQVKAHIERRYGMAWSPAGPWMREYVRAVRAVWDCWQNDTPLDIAGPHYTINLMVPLFNPGPIAHPAIPIHIAAVNALMCQVAGEVGDGIRPHPVCTPSYIETVMLPAVRAGAAKGGRTLDDFRVCMKPLVAAAATEAELVPKVRDARARIAFYASTPQYRAAFDHLGLGELADRLKLLSRAQRWEEMPQHISDDILEQFVTIATYDDIAARLCARYGHVVTDCEFSIAVRSEADREILRGLARTIQAEGEARARRTILGAAA
ncbi:TIGR03617 family F420-dependent LLM class oxidoreductase [Vineibacter terrae]|uniref:TIGR03617 family F420-dependent LLM class oxidoreductase n=1 Tax=Vineibacter terrae TaxID=2586908 RepID=UPI002E35082C|nr:TIGR03617 family F420-dependent LLM class oxidoreductase [Vineibacter terrae]HEX2889613.1 TIGR03617 family F420-dependent LLM class oxidoreductase [Vineibacter terrae]